MKIIVDKKVRTVVYTLQEVEDELEYAQHVALVSNAAPEDLLIVAKIRPIANDPDYFVAIRLMSRNCAATVPVNYMIGNHICFKSIKNLATEAIDNDFTVYIFEGQCEMQQYIKSHFNHHQK